MSRDALKDRLARSELRDLPEDQLRALQPAFPAIEDMRARVRRAPHDNAAPLPPAPPAW